jgi:hypothetical protein
MERIAEASPRSKSRMAGFLYLRIIVGTLFAPFVVRALRHDAGRFGKQNSKKRTVRSGPRTRFCCFFAQGLCPSISTLESPTKVLPRDSCEDDAEAFTAP